MKIKVATIEFSIDEIYNRKLLIPELLEQIEKEDIFLLKKHALTLLEQCLFVEERMFPVLTQIKIKDIFKESSHLGAENGMLVKKIKQHSVFIDTKKLKLILKKLLKEQKEGKL